MHPKRRSLRFSDHLDDEMKKPVDRPIERPCPACKGTGFSIVKQPTRPGVKIYPERCKKCGGKGKSPT